MPFPEHHLHFLSPSLFQNPRTLTSSRTEKPRITSSPILSLSLSLFSVWLLQCGVGRFGLGRGNSNWESEDERWRAPNLRSLAGLEEASCLDGAGDPFLPLHGQARVRSLEG